jgi:hypothetical protein
MQKRAIFMLILIGCIALAVIAVLLVSRPATTVAGQAQKEHTPPETVAHTSTALAPAAGRPVESTHTASASALADAPTEDALPRPSALPENPALRIFVDKAAAPRFGGDFEARVPTINDPADIAWIVYVLRDATDLDAVRNEAANLLRRSHIAGVDQHLLAVLLSAREKERFQSYAVQHLGDLMREYRDGTVAEDISRARTIQTALVAALKNPHFMVRSEAVMALARERDPHAADIIRTGLNDPHWSQGQDLLIRCAKEAELTDLIPTIRPLAYATNDVVRIAAVNVLAQWRDEVSRPAFEEASRSSVPRLQRAGTLAISLLDAPQQ